MNKKAIYEHMLHALENYDPNISFRGFCGNLLAAILELEHNYDYNYQNCGRYNSLVDSWANYVTDNLYSEKLNDFPELMAHKPKEPWNALWWFSPDNRQVRIDILKAILNDLSS